MEVLVSLEKLKYLTERKPDKPIPKLQKHSFSVH